MIIVVSCCFAVSADFPHFLLYIKTLNAVADDSEVVSWGGGVTDTETETEAAPS